MKFHTILEMAIPTESHKTSVWYHGCDDEKLAKSILQNGIQPPDLTNRRGKLRPVSGKVYITRSLETGVVYAIGGSFLGHNAPDSWKNKERRFGYLFVIDGQQLKDIQPDEDGIGEILYDLMNNNMPGHSQYKYDSQQLWWLLDKARRFLTSKQYSAVKRYDDYADLAVAGKKLIPHMSETDMLSLIDAGCHVAHSGALIPKEVWKIDKTRSLEISKDASNFFEIAERVK